MVPQTDCSAARPFERTGRAVDDGGWLHRNAFAFDSEAGERVPGLLVTAARATGKLPVVMVLHGTGGSKVAMRPLLQRLAARGLCAVAIDGRFSGERSGGQPGSEAYQAAIYQTWKTGRGLPLFYDTAGWPRLASSPTGVTQSQEVAKIVLGQHLTSSGTIRTQIKGPVFPVRACGVSRYDLRPPVAAPPR